MAVLDAQGIGGVRGLSDSVNFRIAIPARYGSTRLPGKPLRAIAGQPMIRHVYERAMESGAAEVVIATDDTRIRDAAEGFGAKVCMTASTHPSGTDRIAEVAQTLGWNADDIVVNLQGDEPLMPPALLRQVATDLAAHADADVATLCMRIHTSAELFDPHIVKVIMDGAGNALYFSRAPVPWDRDAFTVTTEELPARTLHFRHIGLYAYRVRFLHEYVRLAPCDLERIESLEQLRVLWHGRRIHVAEAAQTPGHGVDTEQDLERAARILAGDAPAAS